MMTNWMNQYAFADGWFRGILFPLIILDLVLKGFALWRSARRGEQRWFIALLVINSMGILPAIYLLTHKKKK
mgnify:CR=1 FL=1